MNDINIHKNQFKWQNVWDLFMGLECFAVYDYYNGHILKIIRTEFLPIEDMCKFISFALDTDTKTIPWAIIYSIDNEKVALDGTGFNFIETKGLTIRLTPLMRMNKDSSHEFRELLRT